MKEMVRKRKTMSTNWNLQLTNRYLANSKTSRHKLPKFAICCQKFPWVANTCYKLTKLSKSFQKLPTFAKSCHKLTTFATCWKSLPTFAKVVIKLPKVVRHFLKLQIIIYQKMVQNLSKNGAKFIKNGAKFIKKWCFFFYWYLNFDFKKWCKTF